MMMEDDMIIYKDKKCTIERDDVWNEWGDLKCLQKLTKRKLMEAYT